MTTYKQDFLKIFRNLRRGPCRDRRDWQVFADFCEAAALAVSQSVMPTDEREQRYMAIVKRSPEAMRIYPKLFAITVDALNDIPHDFLGDIFQELGLNDHWLGQYFTPPLVARLLVSVTEAEDRQLIERDGFITLWEPCCGAGATIIAHAVALKDMGFDPRKVMRVLATDIAPTAAHMCYAQLWALQIPAEVRIGDSISGDIYERFYTQVLNNRGERKASELRGIDS